MDMEHVKKTMTRIRWRVLAAGGVALSVAGVTLLSAFAGTGSSQSDVQYKETTVTRGDIVVGVTESGTASIQQLEAHFDPISSSTVSSGSSSDSTVKVNAKVEEIFVKAGQQVEVGDPIARLSTDDIASTLDDLQMNLKKAQIALRQAQINRQMKEISAESTLKSNRTKADTAPLQYELTLLQLENALATSKLSLSDLQDNIEDYEALLAGEIKEEYDLDGLEEAWDAAEDNLKAWRRVTIGDSGAETEEELTAKIAEAQKAVTEAKSAYNSAKSKYEDEVDTARTKLKSLKNEYEQKALQYDADKAGEELNRIDAQSELDDSLSTAENAEALYEIELAQLENDVSSEELSVQTLEKKIAALQEYADSDGTLTAPCGGLVMNVSQEVGDTVEWDASIATISNAQNVYVTVSIAQEDISSITLGSLCNVLFSAYEGQKFTGEVDSISVTPAMSNSSTVSYYVKVKLQGDASSIYTGMTGDVTFVTKEISDVLCVSNRAVTAQDGKQYVNIRGEDGTVRQKEITTGFSDGRSVEVVEGLAEGDVVLIESKVQSK